MTDIVDSNLTLNFSKEEIEYYRMKFINEFYRVHNCTYTYAFSKADDFLNRLAKTKSKDKQREILQELERLSLMEPMYIKQRSRDSIRGRSL